MRGSFRYITALLCIAAMILLTSHLHQESKGFKVFPGSPCPNDMKGDGRKLVIQYLPDGTLRLNQLSLHEPELLAAIKQAMKTRVEKLVWIAGDDQLSYGEIVTLISKLVRDTPDLNIAITTRNQIDPTTPVQVRGCPTSRF